MHVDVQQSGSGPRVMVQGEVDLESSPELRSALLAQVAGGSTLTVDLSGVSYIDSSGIASLVEALQACKQAGGRLLLAAPSEAVNKVITLARLDRVFEFSA